VFVHISAIERAGLGSVDEGKKLNYDVMRDGERWRVSADNLQAL
jgi:cold shock protein